MPFEAFPGVSAGFGGALGGFYGVSALQSVSGRFKRFQRDFMALHWFSAEHPKDFRGV